MTKTNAPADRPAILGGRPAFPHGLPLVRPTVPHVDELAEDLRGVLERRVLTNGPLVRQLEERAAERLGVPHCVAVASCTAGLMLVAQAAEPPGEVVLPSFTFVATAHAVVWAGHRPVFADVDPETLTLSPEAAGRAVGPSTRAVVATHVYGTPCHVEALEAVAASAGVRLFFDAAHAFGSRRGEVPVGRFGDAEVFSLTPTKLVVAGEGGIIATGDAELADRFRIGREYANPGDYDSRFPGLNARMSELHAALALRSLATLDQRLARRNDLAARYRSSLAGIAGVSFPRVEPGDTSTFKDLTILVDADGFGVDAACLGTALAAEGIDTRRYYFPPVHRQRAYRDRDGGGHLPVTERAAARVLTLPMWEEMTEAQVDRVAEAIGRIGSWPGVDAACSGAG